MTEPAKPPVAVRIARPYESDDELLANELETIGKTSIILIGAHPRPVGVILRFEMTLASGDVALRGEGRVLGHKEQAFRGQPGLALRFTRLDPRSKALVDRATAMREARATGASGEPLSQRPLDATPPSDPGGRPSIPVAPLPSSPPPAHTPSAPPPAVVASAPPPPIASAPPPASAPAPAPADPLSPPPDRDTILQRLRARGAALAPDRVAEILASRPPRVG